MMQAWLKKANPALDTTDADAKPPAAATTTHPRATKRSASAATGNEGDDTAASSAPPPAKRSTAAGNDPLASKPIPDDGPAELALERSSMHPSWYWRLEKEFGKPYFKLLKSFLDKELKGSVPIYPELENIYTWAKLPFKSVKVVILGQDPYHNPHQAHGLSFSVLPGERPPPSLVNIYKELQSDLSLPTPPATHGYLMSWAKQGVLLLNAVLTVRKNQPASHAKQGWEQLTDAAIKAISDERDGVVFILWGTHAQKKGAGIDKKKHLVLKSAHPSPLSAFRGFFGSRPFSKANEYLGMKGKGAVDWARLSVDDEEEDKAGESDGGDAQAQLEETASAAAGASLAPLEENAAKAAAKEKAGPEEVGKDQAKEEAATRAAAELAALNELANNGLLKDW